MIKNSILISVILLGVTGCKAPDSDNSTQIAETQEVENKKEQTQEGAIETIQKESESISEKECPPCVPPLSELHNAGEPPDEEFISFANEFVNLIATYQPRTAERQFNLAAEMLLEPFLTAFEKQILSSDLNVITKTGRSQIFQIDPDKTEINHEDNLVYVKFIGDKRIHIKDKSLKDTTTEYQITMKTIPRTRLNPYGIAIVDLNVSTKNR